MTDTVNDETEAKPDPQPGEVWRYAWLFVEIIRVGPKTVTYYPMGDALDGQNTRCPRERFMSKFRKTGLGKSSTADDTTIKTEGVRNGALKEIEDLL